IADHSAVRWRKPTRSPEARLPMNGLGPELEVDRVRKVEQLTVTRLPARLLPWIRERHSSCEREQPLLGQPRKPMARPVRHAYPRMSCKRKRPHHPGPAFEQQKLRPQRRHTTDHGDL